MPKSLVAGPVVAIASLLLACHGDEPRPSSQRPPERPSTPRPATPSDDPPPLPFGSDLRAYDEPIASAILEGDFATAARLAGTQAQLAEQQLGASSAAVHLRLRAAFLAGVHDGPDASEDDLQRALAMARQLPASEKPMLARALMRVAGGFRGQQKLEASAFHWEQAVAVWESIGAKNEDLLQCHEQLVQIRDALETPQLGDEHSLKTYQLALEVPGASDLPISNYAYRRLRRGDLDEARRVSEMLFARAKEAGEDLASVRQLRVRIHLHAEEFDEAVAIAREQLSQGAPVDRGYSLRMLADTLIAAGRWSEGRRVAGQFVRLQEEKFGTDAAATTHARILLAKAYIGLKKTDDARASLRRALEIIEASDSADNSVHRAAADEAKALLSSLEG